MKTRVSTLAGCAALLCGCPDATEPEQPRLDQVQIQLAGPLGALLKGDTVRAGLVGFDQFGRNHDTGPVTWRSDDTTIVRISSDGLVQGRSHGSTTIVGAAGGLSASWAITVAGTLHQDPITTSEVWTAATAPHVVRGHLAVGGPEGVTLTLEAGLTLVMPTHSGLDFGVGGPGTLIADGTAAPITLRGPTDVGSTWDGLTFRGPGRAELRHVTLRDCGGTWNSPLACVALRDSGGALAPTILIDDLVLRNGDGTGITVQGRARFESGSRRLSIENMLGVAAIIPVSAAGRFPLGGSIAGNGVNEIQLVEDTIARSSDSITVSTTWGNPGVPWRLFKNLTIEGPDAPTLTIAAGSTVILGGSRLVVGQGAPGGVRIGAAEGNWVLLRGGGVHFFSHALPSALTRTLMQQCGAGNSGCVFMSTDVGQGHPDPVLDSVTILSPDGLGVVALKYGRFGAGSRALRITGSSGYPMILWPGAAATIPPGSSFTGNAQDVILIWSDDVTESMTWPNPGVPYGISYLGVAQASNPVLTLQPGVVLKFNQYGQLSVGVTAPGGLRAVGTAEAPVTFTGYSAGAYPGFWSGIVIGSLADPGTLLQHVAVVDAGAFDGGLQAAVKIARDVGEIIRNTAVRRSADCGIARLGSEPWSTDFTAPHLGNAFENNDGPAQCGP